MATSKPSRLLFSASSLLFIALAACAPDVNVGTDASGEFDPVPSDFMNYSSWTEYDLGGGDAGTTSDACAHLADVPRVAFINKAPPHGSTEFPVGTMIVKQIRVTQDPSTWQVFGMAKRDDGQYGTPSNGCLGWEWYGLNAPGGSTAFQWSGLGPSGADPYASCGPCASCHTAAQANDCVNSPELSLSQW
jgi:hypothetical protein